MAETNKEAPKKEEKAWLKAKELINKICGYPVLVKMSERDSATKQLVALYKKGSNMLKGGVISLINERLAHVRDYRDYISVPYLKEKRRSDKVNTNEIMGQLLDYSSSLDGAAYLLDVLSKFDDELAAKVLTYHITRYMSSPTFLAYVFLARRGVKALASMNYEYSLFVLLDMAEFLHDSPIYNDLKDALHKLKKRKKLPKDVKARLEKLTKSEDKDKDDLAQYR